MKSLVGLSVILGALAAGSANAACTQADMVGNWSTNVVTTTLGVVTGAHCALVIGATGVVASTSSCYLLPRGSTKVTGTFHMAAAPNCQFNGTLKFSTPSATTTLSFLTMSKTKDEVSGVGLTGLGSTAGAFFNMMKTN